MSVDDKCNIAGLKCLLRKIESIKPCWVLNVEKNILKKVIADLEEKDKKIIIKKTIKVDWEYKLIELWKKIFKRRKK